jgi:hypothetical protein
LLLRLIVLTRLSGRVRSLNLGDDEARGVKVAFNSRCIPFTTRPPSARFDPLRCWPLLAMKRPVGCRRHRHRSSESGLSTAELSCPAIVRPIQRCAVHRRRERSTRSTRCSPTSWSSMATSKRTLSPDWRPPCARRYCRLILGSSGAVIAQPILGRVADAWSYPVSYVVSAAVQALALPFIWLARREQARSDAIVDTPVA